MSVPLVEVQAKRASTPRRLVLVRHGQTAWNLEGRAQGHTDVSLDDVGRAQAAAAAPVLAALGPTALWSSDLARARETAEVIGQACGLEPLLDPRLREFDVGERAGLTVPEFAERFPVEHARWASGHITGGVAGAETPDDIVARVVPALEEIWAATGAGETTVVVAHGACLKVALFAFVGLEQAVADSFRGIENCGWAVLEDGPAHRIAPRTGVAGQAVPRLASYNETAHAPQHGPDFATDAPVG